MINLSVLYIYDIKSTCDSSPIPHCESIGCHHCLGERFTVGDHCEVVCCCARGEIQIVKCGGGVGSNICVGNNIVAGVVEPSVCPQGDLVASYLLAPVLGVQLGLVCLYARISYR